MPKVPIIIEPGEKNYSAYAPDLSGCVATGASIEEVKANMQEAIVRHLEGMREDGEPLPASYSLVEYINLSFPHEIRKGGKDRRYLPKGPRLPILPDSDELS